MKLMDNISVAVCAIIKDENTYLQEWISHYKNLGFSHIYLFDNNLANGEKPEDVTKQFGNFVTVDNRYRGKHDKQYQTTAYEGFYNENYTKYNWILFCDIDELVVLHEYPSIQTYILSHNGFDGFDDVLLCWKILDDNGKVYYQDEPMSKRFTHISRVENPQCKSLVRCCDKLKGSKFSCHMIVNNPNVRYCDSCGNVTVPSSPYIDSNHSVVHGDAWINHYRYKTIQEFVDIKLKNWAGNTLKNKWITIDGFFKFNSPTLQKINYIISQNMNYKDDISRSIINTASKRGLSINLRNPQTIQDKINWLKVYDVNPLKSKCADKIKVHEYCKEKLGKDICIPILKIYDSTRDINFDDLPDKFVLKCNHGWNMNIICTDKTRLNINDCVKKLDNWLGEDFGNKSGQLHYSGITPRCYAEKYMGDLIDYKFWCFNGTPIIYTLNDGHGHGDIVYYNVEDDDILNVYDVDLTNFKLKKPKSFNQMLEYAKKLSSDFKFVRVDFYEINGKCYLGELTFTPGNGFFKYKKPGYDKIIGDMLNLD